MKVLISGASVAGPVLAYWLHRYGFEPTIVERTPAHAARSRRPCRRSVRPGRRGRPPDGPLGRDRGGPDPDRVDDDRALRQAPGPRRPEPPVRRDLREPRGDPPRRAHQDPVRRHPRHGTEYVFGDSIATLHDDGAGVDVTFESGDERRFDLVIGADGMHSTVRRLVVRPGGVDAPATRRLPRGVLDARRPRPRRRDGRALLRRPDRRRVRRSPDRPDRAGFLFRTPHELRYDYRDKDEQKALLAKEFRDYGWKAPQLLEHLPAAEDFYFDSISQITLDTWQRGRIALVGDAGFCPAPAVGGGTSLAVVTAYILAGELAAARSDPRPGCGTTRGRYGDGRPEPGIGPRVMRSIIPGSPAASGSCRSRLRPYRNCRSRCSGSSGRRTPPARH